MDTDNKQMHKRAHTRAHTQRQHWYHIHIFYVTEEQNLSKHTHKQNG